MVHGIPTGVHAIGSDLDHLGLVCHIRSIIVGALIYTQMLEVS